MENGHQIYYGGEQYNYVPSYPFFDKDSEELQIKQLLFTITKKYSLSHSSQNKCIHRQKFTPRSTSRTWSAWETYSLFILIIHYHSFKFGICFSIFIKRASIGCPINLARRAKVPALSIHNPTIMDYVSADMIL